MDELTEIKTVVSEAVTNAIIHGYESDPNGIVYISVTLEDGYVEVTIKDEGSRNFRCRRSKTTTFYDKA